MRSGGVLTVLFAIARTAGWLPVGRSSLQVAEIARPRQIYTGPAERPYEGRIDHRHSAGPRTKKDALRQERAGARATLLMPDNSKRERRFNEEEVALIIKRAAELQQTEQIEKDPGNALSLTDVDR